MFVVTGGSAPRELESGLNPIRPTRERRLSPSALCDHTYASDAGLDKASATATHCLRIYSAAPGDRVVRHTVGSVEERSTGHAL
jgi:hypothetical protein